MKRGLGEQSLGLLVLRVQPRSSSTWTMDNIDLILGMWQLNDDLVGSIVNISVEQLLGESGQVIVSCPAACPNEGRSLG